MKYRIIYLVALLTWVGLNLKAQQKKRILFIGNSYTYVNNLPQVLKDMALSLGDTVIFDSYAPGGYRFQNHWSDANTMAKIRIQPWDIVVLQAQSQEPSFSPYQVKTQTYPYAGRLVDSIRRYNPCANILFYMTWGRQNGDPGNCGAYAPVCTYAGMQARLRESYMLFKDSFMTGVAPVGVAWKAVRNQLPAINLYDPDESHPSMAGTYLAASVFYSSVFRKASNSSTYTAGISPSNAQQMRAIASTTVLDSAALWNLSSALVVPQFTYTSLGNNAYSFQNSSQNAQHYQWSFGSTQASPTHTFTGNPPYAVKLVAGNFCKKDSMQLIVGGTTGIADAAPENTFHIWPNPAQDLLDIRSAYPVIEAKVLNSLGKAIDLSYSASADKRGLHLSLSALSPGVYFLHVQTGQGLISRKFLKH